MTRVQLIYKCDLCGGSVYRIVSLIRGVDFGEKPARQILLHPFKSPLIDAGGGVAVNAEVHEIHLCQPNMYGLASLLGIQLAD